MQTHPHIHNIYHVCPVHVVLPLKASAVKREYCSSWTTRFHDFPKPGKATAVPLPWNEREDSTKSIVGTLYIRSVNTLVTIYSHWHAFVPTSEKHMQINQRRCALVTLTGPTESQTTCYLNGVVTSNPHHLSMNPGKALLKQQATVLQEQLNTFFKVQLHF